MATVEDPTVVDPDNPPEEPTGRAEKTPSIDTYNAVAALVAEGKTVKEAATEVAGDLGKTVATVMTAYYRQKRNSGEGGTPTPRAPRAAGTRSPAGGKTVRAAAGTLTAELKLAIADANKALRAIERTLEKVSDLEKGSEAFKAAAKLFK